MKPMLDLDKVVDLLQQRCEISAAWLFGSAATGKMHSGSDVDVAVLCVPGLDKFICFDLRLTLAADLSAVLARDVDVIDMEAAPLFLQHQARRTGRLLLEKDHAYRVEFDVRSRREYFDFAPRREIYHRKQIQRALGGNKNG